MVVATGLFLPGAARAAIACPDLIQAIDKGIESSKSRLQSYRGPPADSELAGVWDPVPFLFPGYEIHQAQWACWSIRKGQPVDAATRRAVFRASRFLLTKRDNEAKIDDGRWGFYWIKDGLTLERAVGVFGPVSQELRAKGLKPYRNASDPDDLGMNFNGQDWANPRGAADLTDAFAELAALCILHSKGFKALLAARGYEASLLEPRPSRLVEPEDEPDPAQLAFLDAERDRILRACPT